MYITLSRSQIEYVIQHGTGSVDLMLEPQQLNKINHSSGVAPMAAVTFTLGPNGQQIDDVVPEGTPGTVVLPVTGHVLSVPRASVDVHGNWTGVGEGIMGYAVRVCKQAGVTVQEAINEEGALQVACPAARPPLSGVAAWPQQVDEFFNRAAYNPVDPHVAAENAAEWQATHAYNPNPTPPATIPTVEGPHAEVPSGETPL
jgi:hypothetical protein